MASSSFVPSLFANPQPPLGYIWTPCTVKGAEATRTGACAVANGSTTAAAPHNTAAGREVERSFLMGSSGKHVPPRVRLVQRAANTTNTVSGANSVASTAKSGAPSTTFEPPLLLVAAAGDGDGLGSAPGRFAAMPGDVLWEECPSVIFTDSLHLPALLAAGGGGGSGTAEGRVGVAQRMAAVWSLMAQKHSDTTPTPAQKSVGAGTTGLPEMKPPSTSSSAFATQYGRGYSAVATGLARTAADGRSRRNASVTVGVPAARSGAPPIVEVASSLQDALATIGLCQSVACWRALTTGPQCAKEENEDGKGKGTDGGDGLRALAKLSAPTAIAQSAGAFTGDGSAAASPSQAAVADAAAAPPLLSLGRYFATREAATVPAALMAMAQRVVVAPPSTATTAAPTAEGGSLSSGSEESFLADTVAKPLGLLREGTTCAVTGEEGGGGSGGGETFASAAFACLWRLCHERSLLLLKDPDGAPEGTPLHGGEGGGDSDPNSASSIMRSLLQQQQQQQAGGGEKSAKDGAASSSEEAVAAFCPIAAMANFTRLAAVANAQLVIVQQAMPIITRGGGGGRNGGGGAGNDDDDDREGGEINFRYRFVVQAVATRPIRRGEEIRLPLNLLASAASALLPSPTSSSPSPLARPAVGLASAAHLALALRQIAEAIAKNPTAAARHQQLALMTDGNTTVDSAAASADGGGGGGEGLGRIRPYFSDGDYRRHLEKVRSSLEPFLRDSLDGGAFGVYLGRAVASRHRAAGLLSMMQRAAAAKK